MSCNLINVVKRFCDGENCFCPELKFKEALNFVSTEAGIASYSVLILLMQFVTKQGFKVLRKGIEFLSYCLLV